MYNEEDYISNLFKDNEHLLEEKPSRRAWTKLEDKLDQEKVRSSRRIYRYISTAAAVIAIVAMISAIALFKNGNSLVADNQSVAMNEQQQTELSINKNASDWQKKYAPETLKEEAEVAVIEETEKADEIKRENSETEGYIANANTDNTFQKQQKVLPSTQAEAQESFSFTTTNQPNLPENIKVQPSKIHNNSMDNSSDIEPIIAEAEIEEEYKIYPEVTSNMSDDVAYEKLREKVKAEETLEKDKVIASKKRVSASKANRNTPNYAPAKNTKITITDFQWIAGNWSNQTDNGLSYEKWTKKDKNTLEAKGYLIKDDSTIFIESIQIKQIRNKIYYIADFGTDKTTTKFELKSYVNGIATFENKKSKSPSKVIITKNGNNTFTITFQEEITAKLQYRNNTENARASRQMSRTNK